MTARSASTPRTSASTLKPGSVEGLQLTVTDMDAARGELVDRGVDVTDVRQQLGRAGDPGLGAGPSTARSGVSCPLSDLTQGGHMYARIATFESDPSKIDDAIDMVRSEVESGDTPEGLEGAKMLMLVNRETGKGLGVTLFESEEAMRRGDEALNAMNPGSTERRTSVEFYEVPVQTVS
jgi:hypothetical protein